MSGSERETELRGLMEELGWRVTHQGEKGPAVDLQCIFPDPEKPHLSGPAMIVYVQVKSAQKPTASAIGLRGLKIMQGLQAPVFWYCVSSTGGRARTMYYLSPEWLAAAVTRESGQRNSFKGKLRNQSLSRVDRNRLCDALHRFILSCYESFLEKMGDAALVPFAREKESAEGWAEHIKA